MTRLPDDLRELIAAGPLTHLSTINADGSPQVTVVWLGLDGDDLLTGHMGRHLKVRNMQRDPRVVLSFDAPRRPDVFLNEYAVLQATATVQPSDQAWDLLDRLTKIYMSPSATFPAPRVPDMSCATGWNASVVSAPGRRRGPDRFVDGGGARCSIT